jgi:23S rRNA (guanosine2251-2'-O)-methyltransferase
MAGKKGPHKGTGGHGRKKLEGKGPTPKATERPGHPAQRRAKAAAKRSAAAAARGSDRPRSGGRGRAGGGNPEELVSGRNAVLEALRAAVPSVQLYLAPGLDRDERLDEIRKLAAARELEVADVPRGELDRLAGEAPHQGVALRVQPFSYLHADDVIRRALDAPQPGLLVALDGVSDPHNLGAIARSAAAFGAHGLLLPELQLGDGPLVIVIGSEGKGLSRLVAETCDQLVSIPTASTLESLNAGVAAGIALYAIAQSRV